ncbi:MAG: ParB/RepB/Spo0J family partition protein [Deltaproteobacteria bacterium]|nr:ParB/RepB/Spo0J family partition protein [Deltaproteobacteria bacterium]
MRMATRKALGRGLSALIPPATEAAAPAPKPDPVVAEAAPEAIGAPLFVPISRIAPNPNQPRKAFPEEELAKLAASIREQGVLQPLVVRERGGGYELIIGERRWRASQLAGLDEVPAVVLDATDRAVVEMALVENVQRADLNPIELAHAYDELVRHEGMTQEEVGRRVGLDRSSVANHLRLLELPEEIQHDLIDQRLTMGHAKAVLQAPEERRVMIRDQVIRGGLSVRATEDLSRRIASIDGDASKKKGPGPSRDVHVVDLEDRLRTALQTKVRIVGRRTRGRVELSYFGEAELERLTERLLGGDG